ncbi:hypothetical protein AYO21_01345 [Fonsecaea monophora]|uniref:Uncharacterized protein n=1 Tax=Fonsecaea monophora TaxID=254056 RepID=A0A177FMG5_9EURO|nr:hypothetical protein AYO21_01345 [Fonsecaea monophora]OAG44349.1 hypothetical protein AYO21_01345 [Fonsecaea monophora]
MDVIMSSPPSLSMHAQAPPLNDRYQREYYQASHDNYSPRYHLPDEIILHVLSYLIPKHGVVISTDSDGGTCPLTIKSLLQTSRTIRSLILFFTKRFPLRIDIKSGKHCQCHALKTPDDILNSPLGKVLRLPLTMWNEIVVTFAPSLHESLDEACTMVHKSLTKLDVAYTTFTARARFRASITCIRRQSFALARTIYSFGCVPGIENIRWSYVFDDTLGLEHHDDQQRSQRTLWDLELIKTFLCPWRWQPRQHGDHPQVKFPKRFTVGPDMQEASFLPRPRFRAYDIRT